MFCIIQLIKKSNLSCITTHSKLWRWRHVQTKSLASGRPMHGCQTNTFCEQNYAPRVSIWLLSPGNLLPCYHAAPYRHTAMFLKALHSAQSMSCQNENKYSYVCMPIEWAYTAGHLTHYCKFSNTLLLATNACIPFACVMTASFHVSTAAKFSPIVSMNGTW